ncbi:DddA-like double-stranded DNA deaminase toxin [Amycolatopsis sp. cg5]|uniref:DddA-like double-stranded DNA deaminase toxin n=1 Tax=Amycolatopsis sp. cg5 TaxID=3238802 RepID=UPI0035240E38
MSRSRNRSISYTPTAGQGSGDRTSHPLDRLQGLLEPDAVKVASPVLRGRGRSNASPLPGPGPLGCDTLLPAVLPPGATLTVHGTAEDGTPTTHTYRGRPKQ